MKKSMTIGDLAKAVGVGKGALRYYEAMGLIPEPQRSESGYRLYSEAYVRRARLIKQARQLGLNLRQTKDLMESASRDSCTPFQGYLMTVVATKIHEVDKRMAELRALRRNLRKLRASLSRGAGEVQKGGAAVLESSRCFCLDEIARVSVA